MTRRKPSWSVAAKDEGDPSKPDDSKSDCLTEQDSEVESQVDRSNFNHNDAQDNGNMHDETEHTRTVPVDFTNEISINENEVYERNGSATSSVGQCPFLTGSEISMESPALSRCSEEPASGRRALSKSQLRDYREAFRLFDKDGDGSITTQELGSVMRSLGQYAMADELRQMLDEIDSDGDGTVSFEEFVDILEKMSEESCESSAEEEEKELRDAFRVFDKHNRGYITASDLRAVLRCLGEDLSEDEIEDMIKEVDVDGDGKIDFYEFVHALGEPENSEECDEDDDGQETPPRTPSPFNQSPNKSPVVKTFVTSPADTPKQKNAPVELDATISQVDLVHDYEPMAGPSKDHNSESKTTAVLSKDHNIRKSTPEPKLPTRPTARQPHSPKAKSSSRSTSRSVSPDPASYKSLGNPITERARSPSLKESNSLNLFVGAGPDKARRLSRVGLVSEEVALISKASFRESYNAMVKPKQKSPTSEFTLNLTELRAMAGLAGEKNRQDMALHQRREYHLDSPNTRGSSYDLSMLHESFDIDGDEDIKFDEIVPDGPMLSYEPVPGFGASAFYLSKQALYHLDDSKPSTSFNT